MKIRSITLCSDFEKGDKTLFEDFLQDAKKAYFCDVETVRFSTIPQNGRFKTPEEAVKKAKEYDEWTKSAPIDYFGGFGLGRYPETSHLKFLKWIPEILSQTDAIFSNCQLAWGRKVSVTAIKLCANVVKGLAEGRDGFLNLRFAGLYNCPPNIPFFPASFACGKVPNFTIAVEAADLAFNAFKNSANIEEARDNLQFLIRDRYSQILSKSIELEEGYGMRFYGVDLTLAPSTSKEGSIAAALEELGLERFGGYGTLFLSSFLADIIKSLGSEAGFCGLMYPVLEDRYIARRNGEGMLTIDSLMLYSAVCGTGLDSLPIPGDVSEEELASIMLDMAGLSVRLSKPLTTRLMPIPGKNAGEMTSFDFEYFVNSRVMKTKSQKLNLPGVDEYVFSD
ncbi:MAG: DUF711 family protein [Candidatus Methanofastidiosia archaeon]